jgi:UDP-N-acetylglucosamine--N-acetylmuramyl-(pentapeptide) pyrophosphoryl-undecaprenol N-acetylglucosamine transferase
MTRTAGAVAPIHVVFAGGGTGGHLFPGLAVAERLVAEQPDVRITFAGSGRHFERTQVAGSGYDHLAIRCRPWPRRVWRLPAFVADNLAGYFAARRFLRDEQVSVVVGLGGYASAATARAAIACRVPLILLEQNAVPGRATRWLAPSADAVCLAMEPSRSFFPARCKLRMTGNPIRAGFALSQIAAASNVPCETAGCHGHLACADAQHWQDGSGTPRDASSTPRQLLVLGGSGGARTLNENVPRALSRLKEHLDGWRVIHQAGDAEHEATRHRYRESGVPATVVPFLGNLPEVLSHADLAVCRAGGTTLAELAASGVPALLVPYPHAADDHQRRNAEVYATGGGCVTLDERDGRGPLDARLADILERLLADGGLRQSMSQSIRVLARPSAAEDVASLIRRAVENRPSTGTKALSGNMLE